MDEALEEALGATRHALYAIDLARREYLRAETLALLYIYARQHGMTLPVRLARELAEAGDPFRLVQLLADPGLPRLLAAEGLKASIQELAAAMYELAGRSGESPAECRCAYEGRVLARIPAYLRWAVAVAHELLEGGLEAEPTLCEAPDGGLTWAIRVSGRCLAAQPLRRGQG